MKRNFWLDVLLFLSGAICIVTGICLDFHLLPQGDFGIRRIVKDIHVYSGYIMAVGIIFHIAWHSGWIKSVTKQLFFKGNHKG